MPLFKITTRDWLLERVLHFYLLRLYWGVSMMRIVYVEAAPLLFVIQCFLYYGEREPELTSLYDGERFYL